MVPRFGLSDQFTDWFAEFCTLAMNDAVWPWLSDTEDGVNDTEIG
jgi:hypothetical protein